eukprot:804464-Rhodomonas_salina.1
MIVNPKWTIEGAWLGLYSSGYRVSDCGFCNGDSRTVPLAHSSSRSSWAQQHHDQSTSESQTAHCDCMKRDLPFLVQAH